MPLPQTGATQYHAQSGLPDKGRAIKGLDVCNGWDLETFNLPNSLTLSCYQLISNNLSLLFYIYLFMILSRWLLWTDILLWQRLPLYWRCWPPWKAKRSWVVLYKKSKLSSTDLLTINLILSLINKRHIEQEWKHFKKWSSRNQMHRWTLTNIEWLHIKYYITSEYKFDSLRHWKADKEEYLIWIGHTYVCRFEF